MTTETPTPASAGPRVLSVIVGMGREPAAESGESEAAAAWAVASAPWHPAILARLGRLPGREDAREPSTPEAGDLRLLSPRAPSQLPSGFRTGAEDAGARLIEGVTDRVELIRETLGRLDPGADPGPADDALTADFLALGTTRWMLADLTTAMGHADVLDHESLAREALAGARSWATGDRNEARNRLRASFELLTQAREKFYPVDAYAIDLVLLDAGTPAGQLAEVLAVHSPFTLIATAAAIDARAGIEPEAIAGLLVAVDEGWADVAGGPRVEADEPLLPVESILWQYREGARLYRKHMDGRSVETCARRRFGMYPQQPQIARRFGIRFGLPLSFDEGRFPLPPESKRLWEAPDGSTLESLTRAPLAADRARSGVELPWRLARSMKDDHVAAVPLLHWPRPVAGWYRDLRRAASYSPVLARWTTLNDFFHLSDRPWDLHRPALDALHTPYLTQAAGGTDLELISRRVRHAADRARFDAHLALRAIFEAISPPRDSAPPAEDGEPRESAEASLERRLESGDVSGLSGLGGSLTDSASAVAGLVMGGRNEPGRAGFLVLNPTGIARRAAVDLPEASPGLTSEGPLRIAQFTADGVVAVVDLPAYGFAWVPRDPDPARYGEVARTLSTSGNVLRNELIEAEIDAATGGLRGVKAPGEPLARVGQQLVLVGLLGPDGQPTTSRMKAESVEVEYGGPALARAVSRGVLVDVATDAPIAGFRQQVRLWAGRPTIELEVTIEDLDAPWQARAARLDPWAYYLACRWAWPDARSTLRRTSLLAPSVTESARPETPDAFEIQARQRRTALLFGGLAHHQRSGPRMLDTLLIAGRETARTFRLGVALDVEYPFHAAVDFLAPTPLVAVEGGPPPAGPAGWFFHVDRPNVAVTRVEHADDLGEPHGRGLVVHLLETAGRAARCRFRLFRDPTWARQTDLQGDLIVDLPVEGDAVLVDLTPHELARIEVFLP